MEYVIAPVYWALFLASLVAAWFGLAHYTGNIMGTVFFIALLISGWTWWMAPAAFLGAWQAWHLPWYYAAPIAAPSVLLLLGVGTAIVGDNLLARARKRHSE